MDGLKRQGMLVAGAGAVCALVLLLVVTLDVIGSAVYNTEIGLWTIRRVAIVFYVVAIGMLAYAGWQVANGRGFGDVMPRLLSWSGILLALGATYDTFGAALILNAFAIDGFRGIAFFDPTYVTLGAVGLMLWLLGGLMKRAVAMARELEDFL